ncbi:MAG: hypothetical protein WC627_06920 [Legionella sp.]|jgi:hypothetical protein
MEHTNPNLSTELLQNNSIDLNCFDMWMDGIKATKLCMDPVSDCFGSALGVVCCVAVGIANAAEDSKRPATRYDVIHANQIRRNEAAEGNCAYGLGLCIGDAFVDTISVSVGIVAGGIRAAFFSCTGNNSSDNSVFGYPREELEQVNPIDSCTQPKCMI